LITVAEALGGLMASHVLVDSPYAGRTTRLATDYSIEPDDLAMALGAFALVTH
jgi:hypothetical protein